MTYLLSKSQLNTLERLAPSSIIYTRPQLQNKNQR